MALRSLRIVGDGGVPHSGKYRVYLDDHDMTDHLVDLRLDMSVGDVNRVEMTLLVSEIDIDGQVLVKATKEDGPERTSFMSKFREWVAA